MTVEELIEELSELPSPAPVSVESELVCADPIRVTYARGLAIIEIDDDDQDDNFSHFKGRSRE